MDHKEALAVDDPDKKLITPWVKYLEAKNHNHERIAELIVDHASDGKENLLHCKDIGLQVQASNSKKPKPEKRSP